MTDEKHKSTKKTIGSPTSPHLQIYKWNISSLTSIAHRFTGVVLYFSIIFIVWYIIYYAYQINPAESAETCDCPLKKIFDSLFSLAAIGVTFSLYYHFANGIRHLFWDIGKGFDVKTARKTGYLTLFIALLLTIITFAIVIYLKLW
ncbi:MAG: succinate dehydrogenase, cytochrome b556 subunit [Alphaproteobacteria bacterium RIFCSPLOWO2_01_FULL_40_26]|nr:MAG: succinate dehydrogenase, cytochrome b556 subunit [Alphaproteobacteria bacterium RIFCSPHIGHO2_02_FULL_40_34]OFW88190.1 MAG: succinate dehydrogenase, cytochrome b556 subunit [Alphaproteobacteria bacterium RIFCSPHIGHO2_01_FULL_40_8]OFW95306.1 MAG: succinate dehydrogenase, cytochrome b556 subunit [Alphaproteobacteria bacterium RIFCSPLOWO2_01_FULL_40_26]OFX09209.1 MAG: succinate dehydrogenase, cytochrome b556 subunit [Alphaproteobacteria bacterium RIFCSPLOWO2_02_FULL_40_19]OFX11565.1 MAG: su